MSEMPDSWTSTTIASVTKPISSIDPAKTPKRVFKYVDIGSIDNKTQTIASQKLFAGIEAPSRARRIIKQGDTLFSTVRTYLKNIAVVPSELDGELTSTGISVLRPNGATDPRYLFKWTCTDEFVNALSSAQDGTMYPAVSDRDVADATIPLPPLLEQQRIVAKIDSLSAKSGRVRGQLDHFPRLVEKYKQAVLATAFRALGSNANLQSLRKCAAFVTSGSRGWARYYSDEGPLFIRVANVRRGYIALAYDDVQRVNPPASAEGLRTLVQGNDILITITADLGRVGLVPENFEEAYVNQHVALLRLRDSQCARFIAWYLTSEDGQRQLLEQNRGMTRAGLGLDDIRAVSVPLPNPQAQLDTVNRIETAFAWIDRLATEAANASKLLDHLDQAVLAKAFRGELVPQDPTDEPASVLLERIRAERATPSVRRRGNLVRA